jgi:hypothetical protein
MPILARVWPDVEHEVEKARSPMAIALEVIPHVAHFSYLAEGQNVVSAMEKKEIGCRKLSFSFAKSQKQTSNNMRQNRN